MFAQGIEIESDCIGNAKPEDSRAESQPKIKLMKVRSIKLIRLSSIRSSTRKARVQVDHARRFHSSSPGCSGESTPIEFPDASPHYMKATSCSQSHAKDIQSSRILTRKQSFKRGKSNLVRMYSSTWKWTLTRKQSGGVELKRKLKRSTSIKLAAGLGKCQYQETSPDAESISSSNNQNEKEFNSLDSYTTSSGNRPIRALKRRLSLRPVRILSRMPTVKSKRTSMGKCSHIFDVQDSNLQRPTCSSTIKDSKFPEDKLNLHEEPSVLRKVCPYRYCSLHGHRNTASVPPLKRFVSIRRRVMKAPKNCNKNSQSFISSKLTANVKRRSQTRKSLQKEDNVLCEKGCSREEVEKDQVAAVPRGIEGRDEEVLGNLQCDAEVLLGETSYPLIYLEEGLNQLNEDFEDGQTEVGFLEIKQTSGDCCSIATEKNQLIFEAIDTAGDISEVLEINKKDERTSTFAIDEQSNLNDSILSHPEEPALNGTLSTNVVATHINMLFPQAVKDTSYFIQCTGSNNDNPEFTWKLSTPNELANAVKETSGPAPDPLFGSLPNDFSCSSAVDCETMRERDTIKGICNGDNEKDDGKLSSSAPQTDSEPGCSGTTNMSDQMQVSVNKYARLWHLIYKHAVSSNQGEGGEKLHSDVEESGERITRSSSSYETDYSVDKENEKAVEIVQKAFDEILLPEIQNFSSEDNSTPRDVAPDHYFLRNSYEEDNRGVSYANKSSMEMTVSNSDNPNSPDEEGKASSTTTKQSEMKVSRSWSNLKKLLLLKRFVKALENVRSFIPRKPRFLKSDPYSETEKVNLKHLIIEQSKNAEEWMLDFAIRKVISKLAPAQKKRVALLVEAFETVLPFSETDAIPRSISAIASEAPPLQTIDITSVQYEGKEGIATDNPSVDPFDATLFSRTKNVNANSCSNETEKDTILVQAAERYRKVKENVTTTGDKVEDIPVPNVSDCSTASGLSDSSSKPDDSTDTCDDEAPNGTVRKTPRNMISNFNSQSCPRSSDLGKSNIDAKYPANMNNENLDAPRSLILNRLVKVLGVNGSNSSSGMSAPHDESTASGKGTTEGAQTSSRIHDGSTTFQESGTENRFDEAYDSGSGKQNFTKLWYMVYKHMASGVEEKEGPISTPDVEDDQDPSDGVNSNPGTNGSHDEMSFAGSQDLFEKEQQIRLHQIEAVKIVEEAIDAIVPDYEEHPPQDQSLLGAENKTGKKELEEGDGIIVDTNLEEFEKDSIKTEAVCRNEVDSEGKWAESDSVMSKELEENLKVKPNQHISRSWGNLKKVILLRRFIKSLEKLRLFKPRAPRFLPMEPEKEAEKVQLRHNDIEGRRDAEEWMLDYALQRVVSKLTPARRKKVSLLVEAFETVIPTIKT